MAAESFSGQSSDLKLFTAQYMGLIQWTVAWTATDDAVSRHFYLSK